MAASTLFDQICDIVLGTEAGFSNDSQDPGNWTGGKVGVGTLRGTKYGISAGAYPNIDIANLTIAQARAYYKADYWAPTSCDSLPAPVALMVFDGAVNSGFKTSAKWLQSAVDAYVDGNIGPQTLAAVRSSVAAHGADALCAEILSQRIVYDASLGNWKTEGLGWARRISKLPYQAQTLLQK